MEDVCGVGFRFIVVFVGGGGYGGRGEGEVGGG